MTVYIFRRVISSEQKGWGVYRVDNTGHQTLVEQFDKAPEAKRHAEEIRRMTATNA